MKSYLAAIALGAALLLSSCATQQTGGAPQTAEQQLAAAQQTVFQVQQTYNAVVSAMLIYKRLPICGSPGATQLCSKTEVVRQLQVADQAAYDALQEAQKVVRAPGAGANAQTYANAALAAMKVLSDLAATLPKGG